MKKVFLLGLLFAGAMAAEEVRLDALNATENVEEVISITDNNKETNEETVASIEDNSNEIDGVIVVKKKAITTVVNSEEAELSAEAVSVEASKEEEINN